MILNKYAFKKGDVIKVIAGRKSSNGWNVDKIKKAKILSKPRKDTWTNKYYIDIKVLDGSINLQGSTITVFADAFEPFYGQDDYEVY